MADIDIADVAETLARVQLNYSYLAQAWYDIFYNPTPMEVEVQFYDDSGNSKVYKIPNRATDRALFVNGSGSPEDAVAGAIGTIYQDTDTGIAYIKMSGESASTSGWVQLISQSDINGIILRGSQSPEGVVLAPPGVLYVNTDEEYGTLYMKRSTTGRTGWERIDSYPTSFVREVFTVEDGTSTIKLNGICDNALLLSIYVDGTLMNPNSYTLWGDQRTVEFTEAVTTTDTRDSIEIIAQYFMDVHLDESVVAEELRTLVEEATAAADTCTTVSTEVIQAATDLQIKIDEAVETATTEAVENIQSAYAEEVERLEEISSTIENSMTNMYNTVKAEYKEISDWYAKITESRTLIAEMQRDVTSMVATIRTTTDAFVAQYGEDNIMLKSEYVPELTRIEAKINSEDEKLRTELKADIARVDDTILTKEEAINTELERLDTALTTSDSELRALIATYEETNEEWHNAQDTRVGLIEENYYNDNNMPIDKNALYKNNKYLNTDLKSTVDDTTIVVNIRPDMSYYTVDLGEVMTEQNSDCIFDYSVSLGGEVLTEFENIDTTDENTSTDYPTEVLYQIRVMFKNESVFTPFIEWDDSKIIWLGEEPELEASKNYLMEFISYDNGVIWYAHVLGICQPAIRVDTFTTTLNIICSNAPSGSVEVDVYYDLDGVTCIYDGTYTMVDGVLTISEEVERRYRNTELSNIRLHASTDDVFVKHVWEGTIVLESDGEYTFNLDWDNTTKEQYTFALTLTSDETEAYMQADETLSDVSSFDFVSYVDDGRVQYLIISESGVATEYTFVELTDYTTTSTDSDGNTVTSTISNYYMNLLGSDGNTVQKVAEDVLGDSETIVGLRSPYYVEVTNSAGEVTSTYYQMSVEARLTFSQGREYPETNLASKNLVYIYNPDTLSDRGCTITFDNINDTIMDVENVNEPESYVDNYVIKAQLHHKGQVESDNVVPCYESVDGIMVNVVLNGSANMAVSIEGTWEATYEETE